MSIFYFTFLSAKVNDKVITEIAQATKFIDIALQPKFNMIMISQKANI